ncbi:hypothetical protein EDB92DRAFT_1981313 [Lactarius akahatsu]|uniref:Uncharacterized protein n=1 Tax=Lactarius akahatsu TaxID=416441 RepID=A0AAD4L5N3_9AGAM|nr:hypothetical protein EDB92DRAFT_1981313 [Lactarius akahatsu]
MGKKNKDEAPNPNGVVNRDILQRLNFLYQASAYLESISCKSDDSTEEVPTGASGSARPTAENNGEDSSRRIPAPPVLKPESAAPLHEDAVMEVDKSGDSAPRKSKRRRGPPPRSPPLFEREGHVVFRGLVQIEPKPP